MTDPLPSNVVPLRRPPGVPLAERDDDALMLLASGGQRDAFRVLVERHGSRVVRFCTRMTSDRRIAEELAQETWLSVWGARDTYKPNGQFVVWLLVAARNRCLNARRGDARRSRVFVAEPEGGFDDAPADDPAQLDRLIAAEERRRVARALAELPAPMREAVTLRYADALAYEQIAEVTGANASTVRSRVFHGVKKLHELLAGRDSGSGSSAKTSTTKGGER
ncbi:MAG TPA: RNA polymerase sigma factor [Labilithrix sp.]|nr:RNA polymerase sigma factor [Labilithrix sp.]